MASDTMKDLLNSAIARELSVSISYMWQHVIMESIDAGSVGTIMKKIAIIEMTHAEEIAERLVSLGGMPTTQPSEVQVGPPDAKEMLMINLGQEQNALKLYSEIIARAEKENDPATRKLFEEILRDEEEHHSTFTTLLGIL
ncbi:MAG: ferritin-like domain-containing protein [Alphaproteobacteria bacterium]|uniref:Bacterioferritin n=1 Tax=Candidatus Nitrobium versatile TaxID=2884831 RepID=A0A953J8S3_9BACT|nr:ferritin-like domain-containing protein [Candidatus Nitrobium versatile]